MKFTSFQYLGFRRGHHVFFYCAIWFFRRVGHYLPHSLVLSLGGHRRCRNNQCFINVLIDGLSVGGAPDDTVTKNWATAYNLTFPVGTDKNRDLAKYFTSSGFPLNVLVDTSNMKIYYVKNASSCSI